MMKYFKIHFAAFMMLCIMIAALLFFLVPTEKRINKMIYEKNNKLAENYDIRNDAYKDLPAAIKMQEEINDISADLQTFKLAKTGAIFFLLLSLIGVGANYLQFIFTTLKFNCFVNGDTEGAKMRVLAAALLSSAITICVVYYSIFTMLK